MSHRPDHARDALRRIAAPTLLLVVLSLASCVSSPSTAPEPPRHAVLITVDTLRPDRLGAYGYARGSTPSLDALAHEAIRFERAYSHASMTLPSVATLLTGVLSTEHRVLNNGGGVGDIPTLATRLKQNGFATGAFLGSYILRPGRGLDRGFDSYTQEFQATEGGRLYPENRAGPLTDEAISWVRSQDPARRLFLWVHYQEPHGAYDPPSYRTEDGDRAGLVLERNPTNSGQGGIPKYQWLGHGRLAEYEARYDGEITEVDRHLGRLLDALEASGVLQRSVVVLTSDHGEAFGEGGLYCAHGEGLGEALLRVPLLLRVPGHPPRVREETVRLIDVSRTVLEALSIDASGFEGKNLLENVGDRPVVAMVRNGDIHWRSYRLGGNEIRQASGGPPMVNVEPGLPAEGREAVVQRLEAALRRAAPWPRALDPHQAPLSAEEREALRALGYVE